MACQSGRMRPWSRSGLGGWLRLPASTARTRRWLPSAATRVGRASPQTCSASQWQGSRRQGSVSLTSSRDSSRTRTSTMVRTRRVTAISRVLMGLVLAVLTSSCGDRGHVTVSRGDDVDAGLAKARRSAFPIYYLGRSFAGLPLTDVVLDRQDQALIAYGTCRIALPADGGCSVPIQIQDFPFKFGDWRLAVNCYRRPELLGVPTVRHDGLVLFTGTRVVKIYARDASEDRRVAMALRRVAENHQIRRLPEPPRRIRELQAHVCR